jgi:hypothetical protein
MGTVPDTSVGPYPTAVTIGSRIPAKQFNATKLVRRGGMALLSHFPAAETPHQMQSCRSHSNESISITPTAMHPHAVVAKGTTPEGTNKTLCSQSGFYAYRKSDIETKTLLCSGIAASSL